MLCEVARISDAAPVSVSERLANAVFEIVRHFSKKIFLLGLGAYFQFILFAAQACRLDHVVLEDLHRLRHCTDLVAAIPCGHFD